MPKQNKIKDLHELVQPSLFSEELESRFMPDSWPKVLKNPDKIHEVLVPGYVGLDFEFSGNRISIIGLASEDMVCCVQWRPEHHDILWEAGQAGVRFVGHSVAGAEHHLLCRQQGKAWPKEWFEDSMVSHYLCNQVLCSATGKEEDEAENSMGYMDLWTCASLVTDVPNWKICRRKHCVGPCPRHDVFGYCGLDAWASRESFLSHLKTFESRGISKALYRELVELGFMLNEMSTRGVNVDIKFVKDLDKSFESRKAELFPEGKPFNPRSPKQAMDWYKDNGLSIQSIEKDSIRKVLEQQAAKHGYPALEDIPEEGVPEILDVLRRHYEYKKAGKGLDSWFSPKYIRAGKIHPRFIHTGTSTGRLSSSKPNCQNIPARGFGATVRQAIIPNPGFDLVKADYKNLEFRMAAWQGGQRVADLGEDPFQWLIERVPGKFEEASERLKIGMSARDLAKMTAHANTNLAGLSLIDPSLLKTERLIREYKSGALRIYHPDFGLPLWEYEGNVVAFTGSVLAENLFGNHSFAARAAALEIQEDIFNANFPVIRKWHRQIMSGIEGQDFVRSLTGRVLALYGSPDERAKTAATVHSQGTAADHVQAIMLLMYRRGDVPILQVHDEVVLEFPSDMSDDEVMERMAIMKGETWRLPGSLVCPGHEPFTCPVSVKRGKNWGQMKPLGVLS